MKTHRRAVLKKLFTSAAGVAGVGMLSAEDAEAKNAMEAFSTFENLVYITGAGAHTAPFEIANHAKLCLDQLKGYIEKEGSSMEKVLKVNVWLNDIADFDGMNAVYKGMFGSKPPVRTTVSVAKGGVPGNSLVEMDAICYI